MENMTANIASNQGKNQFGIVINQEKIPICVPLPKLICL
jgi:hypothetical protein